MASDIRVGDYVRLINLPDWLMQDLPEDEQKEMRAFIGQYAVVSEIDDYGYYWLGFGNTTEENDLSHYAGHSFCVPKEFIKIKE